MKRDYNPRNRPKTFEEKLKDFMKLSEQIQSDAKHKTRDKKRRRKSSSASGGEER